MGIKKISILIFFISIVVVAAAVIIRINSRDPDNLSEKAARTLAASLDKTYWIYDWTKHPVKWLRLEQKKHEQFYILLERSSGLFESAKLVSRGRWYVLSDKMGLIAISNPFDSRFGSAASWLGIYLGNPAPNSKSFKNAKFVDLIPLDPDGICKGMQEVPILKKWCVDRGPILKPQEPLRRLLAASKFYPKYEGQ